MSMTRETDRLAQLSNIRLDDDMETLGAAFAGRNDAKADEAVETAIGWVKDTVRRAGDSFPGGTEDAVGYGLLAMTEAFHDGLTEAYDVKCRIVDRMRDKYPRYFGEGCVMVLPESTKGYLAIVDDPRYGVWSPRAFERQAITDDGPPRSGPKFRYGRIETLMLRLGLSEAEATEKAQAITDATPDYVTSYDRESDRYRSFAESYDGDAENSSIYAQTRPLGNPAAIIKRKQYAELFHMCWKARRRLLAQGKITTEMFLVDAYSDATFYRAIDTLRAARREAIRDHPWGPWRPNTTYQPIRSLRTNRLRSRMTKRICTVDDCVRRHYARGFCEMHWTSRPPKPKPKPRRFEVTTRPGQFTPRRYGKYALDPARPFIAIWDRSRETDPSPDDKRARVKRLSHAESDALAKWAECSPELWERRLVALGPGGKVESLSGKVLARSHPKKHDQMRRGSFSLGVTICRSNTETADRPPMVAGRLVTQSNPSLRALGRDGNSLPAARIARSR